MQGYTWPIKRNCNFLEYFSEYVDNYQKKDLRMMVGTLKRWKAFLARYYPALAEYIRAEMMTPKLIKEFVDYLQEHGRGEGPLGYYQRFRKVVKSGMGYLWANRAKAFTVSPTVSSCERMCCRLKR